MQTLDWLFYLPEVVGRKDRRNVWDPPQISRSHQHNNLYDDDDNNSKFIGHVTKLVDNYKKL